MTDESIETADDLLIPEKGRGHPLNQLYTSLAEDPALLRKFAELISSEIEVEVRLPEGNDEQVVELTARVEALESKEDEAETPSASFDSNIIDQLIANAKDQPEKLLEVSKLFGQVLLPWEQGGREGMIAAPEWRRHNIHGRLIVLAKPDHPTWKIQIDGEFVQKVHQVIGVRTRPEDVLARINRMLLDKGYLISSDEVKKLEKAEKSKAAADEARKQRLAGAKAT